jgi:hypothetical protein
MLIQQLRCLETCEVSILQAAAKKGKGLLLGWEEQISSACCRGFPKRVAANLMRHGLAFSSLVSALTC